MDFVSPIKKIPIDKLYEINLNGVGGFYPVGLKNYSWHNGIHLETNEAIQAIYHGHVIAYRFFKEDIEHKIGENKITYSNSFVLIKHNYRSIIGNQLTFFSLYMHLDPNPQNKDIPHFICENALAIKTSEDPPSKGIRIRISTTNNNTRGFLSYYRKFTKIRDINDWYMEVKFKDFDGKEYIGVIKARRKNFKDQIKLLQGNEYQVLPDKRLNIESPYYKGHIRSAIRDRCGLRVRTKPNFDKRIIVAVLPKGTIIEYEPYKADNRFGILKKPDLSKELNLANEKFYIYIVNKIDHKQKSVDKSKIGKLVVLDDPIRINTGDFIGKPGNIIGHSKKGIHFEIFTGHKLEEENSFLLDQMQEKLWARKRLTYRIPTGTEIESNIDLSRILNKGDIYEILEMNTNSNYVKIKIIALRRRVLRSSLQEVKAGRSSVLNRTTYRYHPIKDEKKVLNLKKAVGGFFSEKATLFYLRSRGISRDVLYELPEPHICWVDKTALIKETPFKARIKILKNSNTTYTTQHWDTFTIKSINENEIKISLISLCRDISPFFFDLPWGKQKSNRTRMKKIKNRELTFNWLENKKDTVINKYSKVIPSASNPKFKKGISIPGANWRIHCILENSIDYTIEKKYIKQLQLEDSIRLLYFENPEDFKKQKSKTTRDIAVNKTETNFISINLKSLKKDSSNSSIPKNYININQAGKGHWVDVTGLTPISPHEWPGFMICFENNYWKDYNAVCDFEKVDTFQFNKKKKLIEIPFFKNLLPYMKKNNEGSRHYDVRLVVSNQEKYYKLLKLITKTPSEWTSSEKRWESLKEVPNISNNEIEAAKSITKNIYFWEKVQEAGHFKHDSNEIKNIKYFENGKAVYFFQPVMFLEQMNFISDCTINRDDYNEYIYLVTAINNIMGNSYQFNAAVEISNSLYNRIGKFEWKQCDNLLSVLKFSKIIDENKLLKTQSNSFKKINEKMKYYYIYARMNNLQFCTFKSKHVLFHKSNIPISKMPWDSTYLNKSESKKEGNYKFYEYLVEEPSCFATVLQIKSIQIIMKDDIKKQFEYDNEYDMIDISPGETVSYTDGYSNLPLLFDVKKLSGKNITFKYKYNINNAFEELKQNIQWKIIFDEKVGNETVTKTQTIDNNDKDYIISFKISNKIAGYKIKLAAFKPDGQVLSKVFNIQLTREEYLIFTGNYLLWIDKVGQYKNWHSNITKLKATSGDPDKRTSNFQSKDGGPIPQGLWYIKKESLPSEDIFSSKIGIVVRPKNIKNKFKERGTFYIISETQKGFPYNETIVLKKDAFKMFELALGKDIQSYNLRVMHREHYDIGRYGTLPLKNKDNSTYVEKLQKDLVTLGYWINSGQSRGSLNKTDKSYGPGVISAITTFQYEHMIQDNDYKNFKLPAGVKVGEFDKKTAQIMINILNNDDNYDSNDENKFTYKNRPSVPILGPINIKTVTYDIKRLHQLPSTKEKIIMRSHLSPKTDGSYINSNGTLIINVTKQKHGIDKNHKMLGILHNDIYGTKYMTEMLYKTAKEWKKQNHGPIAIGDISLFTGGQMPGHKTHADGAGVDVYYPENYHVKTVKNANWIGSDKFDKKMSLDLAKAMVISGAQGMVFNCKYVIDKLIDYIIKEDIKHDTKVQVKNNKIKIIKLYPIIYAGKYHHHHFHVYSEIYGAHNKNALKKWKKHNFAQQCGSTEANGTYSKCAKFPCDYIKDVVGLDNFKRKHPYY